MLVALKNYSPKLYTSKRGLIRLLTSAAKHSYYDPVPTTPSKPITILGIETSCDDTTAAVVNSDRKILSEAITLQHHLHESHGGIVPNIALKSHTMHLPSTVRRALDESGISAFELDAIAVTRGPGIPACLSVGLNAAKTLAAVLKKPLIGVHHMEGHALTARLTETTQPQFPFLCLLISGGHTLILLAEDVNKYKMLGTTLDDSVGEAFDKVARSLKLPWIQGRGGGAGAALEKCALSGDATRYTLPIPLNTNEHRYKMNFSFSGLKAAVSRMVEEQVDTNNPQMVADMAASFQSVILKHLENKITLAFNYCVQRDIKVTSLVASGGVASNMAIRHRLTELSSKYDANLVCPPPHLCTDNGVMIAWAGIERYQRGLFNSLEIDFIPKWPIEEINVPPQ
ncbi:peptidase M22, glycoprotease [Basidiobolus meristosporus CBS 931.73]|uniref:N(6)-L-threonylcarbamoyladenine synthase n=1 Tax=Basidiobolus meristosporus CBS 931.73 TaxID=1314790 RepID=A0A1Y1Y2A4_9FUNG|nr:peptidase M22, glycoprotease [Basidiobolus meristosporus CBS 931.73]|eukprot:ORX92120.1 peptidase M22, glycoprotease [Basidiobolus meristosporus CBS 931.73]